MAGMSGTAEIYDAHLEPGKLETLTPWVVDQDWFEGDPEALEQVTSYRLVDPAGAVGIEGFLLRAGGRTVHVPVTYRAEPLEGVTAIGEMEHSVLGHRHVYDGAVDPVYLSEVERVIRERDTAADHKAMESGETTPDPVDLRGGGAQDGPSRGVDVRRVLTTNDLAGTDVSGEAPAAGTPLEARPGTLVARWRDGDAAHTAVLVRLGTAVD